MRPDWRTALDERVTRTIDPGDAERTVVVAAHPDDETLAAAGYLRAAAHAAGVRVEIVVATDGEAALPEHDDLDRAALGRRRRTELHSALDRLGLGDTPVHWLGLPDSALDADVLAPLLAPLLADADTCLAPWALDPHPDHAAAGRATSVAAPVSAHRWQYPVWMWTGRSPDDPDLPWSRAHRHDLGDEDRAAKARAIEAFSSQTAPLVAGGRAVLPPDVLAHFGTGRELFFRDPAGGSAPASRFAGLYRDGNDPWDVRDSWYEQRKRDVVLACLPQRHYRHAAEPGCGLGELTRELAARCDRVSASDYTDDAVRATASLAGGLPGVEVDVAALPGPTALPDGIDLAVLSEVVYYLGEDDVGATVDRLAATLVVGGDLVLAHWRGWPVEAPADAATVHARFTDDPRFDVLVELVDEEFLMHVLRRR
ncbi:bifunctional PIG-L family deacetylase/class I SAM-dependent methyltransferase [Pseudonocardia endophytica]|uniref:LmbE family N-acetylglucosaminyl deacetylase n=1 Tax=Pseudonocardia endophytica TaxID=401976 RepID=A0A4R1HMI0_PSEEN|nr:bifunctional PIG-L family deacetylase/class I SAM-dependent methyltransferase [Pseudonocardia endophytica]TCK21765.1 LmbE family N-acetylglucosaminyl deacetylase [Pseudonocardia endophytica]